MDKMLSDHKTMVQDIFIETNSIASSISEMNNQLQSLIATIEHLTRTLGNFQESVNKSNEEIINNVSAASAETFKKQFEQLDKFKEVVDGLSSGKYFISERKQKRLGFFKTKNEEK